MRSGSKFPLVAALVLTACSGRGARGVPDRIERPVASASESGTSPVATTTVSSVTTPVPPGAKPRIVARAYSAALATTKTHVSKVLQKLGLRDRVQAAIFAYEIGLIEPGASSRR